MASFVTCLLSVVYMAVTVEINQLHLHKIAFKKIGYVIYKSEN